MTPKFCPYCGKPDPALLSSSAGPLSSPPKEVTVLILYKCECGFHFRVEGAEPQGDGSGRP